MAIKLLGRAEDIFDNVVAIESTYNLMFGMTDLDVFVDYDNNAISTAARVFVAFFLFLVVIVMLNMLIAIMADSFDNVQENLKIQSFRAKARVCADLLIDFSERHPLFKQEYLHICTIKDEAGESALMSNQSQWEGRLKAVKREIKESNAKMDARMNEMKADMGAKMDEMNARMEKILEAILKK